MNLKIQRMRFLAIISGWLALHCTMSAAVVPTNSVRVALMTFTVDDNSYRSTLAAVDLAAILQAELSGEPGIQWVERAELKAAEREFELSQLGLPDGVGSLRRGHYAAADWTVTGGFHVASNGAWALTIEVVETRRADVLAVREAGLSRVAHPTLQSALPQAAAVASEVRAALSAARRRWEEIRNRRTVALLMLLDAEEIEAEVARALESAPNETKSWRVSRLGRTGTSMDENELTLLGLARDNAEAWENLADAYVWGRLAVRHPPMTPGGRIPSPDYEAALELTIWDVRSEPKTVAVTSGRVVSPEAALGELAALGPRAITNLLAALNQTRAESLSAEVRPRLAQTLFERAKSWRTDSEHWSRWRSQPDRWVQDEARQQVRLLEAATFFDPGNQAAHELLLRIQFRPAWQFPPNRFWLLFKRSEAWGHYVDRFGLSPAPLDRLGIDLDASSIPGAYVSSAFQLVDLSALGNKEDRGFPRDMSGATARHWLKGFTTELARRIIKTAHEPTTQGMAGAVLRDGLTGNPKQLMMVEPKLRKECIEALWPSFAASVPAGQTRRNHADICQSVSETFAELGLVGETEKLFVMLDKPAKPKADGTNSNAPIHLPRANQLTPLPPFRR